MLPSLPALISGSEVVLLAHYDSRRGSVVSIVQRTVFAHIKLCLEDKPKELLNVLKKLTVSYACH